MVLQTSLAFIRHTLRFSYASSVLASSAAAIIMACPSAKGLVLLAAILINLHLGAAVRIGSDGAGGLQPLFVSPPEPKLQFFNAYTHPESAPAPVNEQPEPENPITPRVPTELGVQLENVINSQRFRYPDPTTTPRPGTFRASVYVPPGLPSAFSRAPPQPQNNVVPFFTGPDGSLIPGISEIDHIVATNRLQQDQARRNQQDAYQAQVLRQVQQDALDVIRESVSLITTNPGARRRPNTVVRPQQLSPPPQAYGTIPGHTQAIFQNQPLDQLQQQPFLAQPQQALFQAPAPTAPSFQNVQEAAPIPSAPAYPFGQHQQVFLQQQQQPEATLLQHQVLPLEHAAPSPSTGVSYSRTYHVSLNKPLHHL